MRLDLLTEADLPELAPVLGDPEIYAHGYVMHRRPSSPADAVALARERFMAGQGAADGRGRGRTAYAIRLVGDGTLVGTWSFAEAPPGQRETSTSGRRCTAAGCRWGRRMNPEAKLLLLSHCFDECGTAAG